MCSVYESYGSIFCLISSLHPARRYILLRDLHQAPPSIQNSILLPPKMETASVPSGTDTWRYEKRVKPSQGQLGLIRGLILSFFDNIGGYIIKCMKICELWRIKTSSKWNIFRKKSSIHWTVLRKWTFHQISHQGSFWLDPWKTLASNSL